MKIVSCQNAINFTKNITLTKDISFNDVSFFEDKEMLVKINNLDKLKNEDVLVIQSLSNNVNDALVETFFTLDIVRNALPKSISLLITYMGYSRQDKLSTIEKSFSARIVANLLSLSYLNRIFTVDIHSTQTLGFFNVPVINIDVDDFVLDLILKNHDKENMLLVSPDTGNVKTIIKLADSIDVDYNVAIKYRPKANENKILSLIGHDIGGKDCIIIDDIVDSAGTLCNVAEKLTKKGANSITAYITHPVLSEKSINRINNSYITKLYVSNTIDCFDKLEFIKNVDVFCISDYCIDFINKYI